MARIAERSSSGEDDRAYGVAAIENGTSMCHHSRESRHRLAHLVLWCPPQSTGEGVFFDL
jgi:hypothetical protein